MIIMITIYSRQFGSCVYKGWSLSRSMPANLKYWVVSTHAWVKYGQLDNFKPKGWVCPYFDPNTS